MMKKPGWTGQRLGFPTESPHRKVWPARWSDGFGNVMRIHTKHVGEEGIT